MLSRILVADDSEAIQKAIRLAFQGYSVTIYEASSYVETLNTCKKCRPELIIVDASLTGTDGPGDFQNIMAISGRVPMILLEGSYEPIDREAFKNLGLNHLVKKPFSKDELLSVLSHDFALTMAAGDASYQQETYEQEDFNQPEIPYQRPEPTGTVASDADYGHQEIQQEEQSDAEPSRGHQNTGETRRDIPPPPPVYSPSEGQVEAELPDEMFSQSAVTVSTNMPPPPPGMHSEKSVSESPVTEAPSEDFLNHAIDSTFAGILPQTLEDPDKRHFGEGNGRDETSDYGPMDTPETFSKEIFRTSEIEDRGHRKSQPGVPADQRFRDGGLMSSEMEPGRARQGQLSGASFVREEYEDTIRTEVRKMVREAVDEYCKMFFKPLLKELVTEELRKLAQEQASHMTDS